MANGKENTGTRDATYNVISVLYHSLQAADTCEVYLRDANQAGDQDLANFFRDAQESNRQIADRAKQLLKQKLG